MPRRAAAVLATARALAAPAPALAQSVGDDQYRDPFAGEQPSQDDPSGGGETGGSAPQGSAGSSPAPAPSTTSAPINPTATSAGELPRTGPAAAFIFIAGVVLVGAGLGLRRSART
jgi:hypothetical protein